MTEALEKQPWLGSETLWPAREDLVERVRARSFLYSGKVIGKDATLCRAVCVDLLSGFLSERQIAAKYGIARESIHAISRVMEERGELRPLVEQVKAAFGDVQALMVFQLRNALIEGKFSAAQIPIALGIVTDKKGQLDAAIVPGTNITEGDAAEANIRAYFAALKLAKQAASDSQSLVPSVQVVDVTAVDTTTNAVDTLPDTLSPATDSAGPGAAGSSDVAMAGGQGAQAGRGDRHAPAPPDPRPIAAENFGT